MSPDFLKGIPPEFSARCTALYVRALEVPHKVLPVLQQSPIGKNAYRITHRIKSKGDIFNKVCRKINVEGKKDYTPESVTDAPGFRVVTLFQGDVVTAVKGLLDLIQHLDTSVRSPFVQNELHEIIIVNNRPDNDPLSILGDMNALIDSRSDLPSENGWGRPVKEIRNDRTGYSSVHLTLFCPVEINEGGREGIVSYQVPTEIQVRTIFEDAWGDINHKLIYSRDRSIMTSKETPDPWKSHMNALKAIMDGCIQYAEIIKKQALGTDEIRETLLSTYRPLDSGAEVLERFSGSPEQVRRQLAACLDERDKAEAASLFHERRKLFQNALDSFRSVFESVKASAGDAGDRVELEYLINMEIAYCLLSIQTDDTIVEAIRIYQEVERERPNDVFPLYRHAQGLSLQGKFEEAIGYFERARNMLAKATGLQGHWIHEALNRGLGYAYWKRSEEAGQDGKRSLQRDLLVKAHKYTMQGLQTPGSNKRQRAVTLNNLIYYETSLLQLSEDDAFTKHYRSNLNTHVRELERDFDLRRSTRVTHIHSLALAYYALEEMGNAYGFAQRLVRLITALDTPEETEARREPSGAATILSESERRMLDDGLRIMREALPRLGND